MNIPVSSKVRNYFSRERIQRIFLVLYLKFLNFSRHFRHGWRYFALAQSGNYQIREKEQYSKGNW